MGGSWLRGGHAVRKAAPRRFTRNQELHRQQLAARAKPHLLEPSAASQDGERMFVQVSGKARGQACLQSLMRIPVPVCASHAHSARGRDENQLRVLSKHAKKRSRLLEVVFLLVSFRCKLVQKLSPLKWEGTTTLHPNAKPQAPKPVEGKRSQLRTWERHVGYVSMDDFKARIPMHGQEPSM